MSVSAKKRYINSSTRKIDERKLKLDSVTLPSRYRNWKDFKKSFDNESICEYTFMSWWWYCIYILVYVKYTIIHYLN